ncbi:MAG: acyl-CoA thioesterase [Pseudomonadales bacterium]|nr:acyl-CoA thioesterase [Pseudomonadales bacterium]
MHHYKLVLPEHLNHYGFLFGGYLLHWLDEVAYITATVEFPGCEFVTVSMDNVAFKRKIQSGEVLKFNVEQQHLGTTSVRYMIQAFGQTRAQSPDTVLFETTMSFVCVDKDGNSKPIK